MILYTYNFIFDYINCFRLKVLFLMMNGIHSCRHYGNHFLLRSGSPAHARGLKVFCTVLRKGPTHSNLTFYLILNFRYFNELEGLEVEGEEISPPRPLTW